MNAVDIDVPKGKSMVAILHPFSKVVSTPFEIKHTTSDINSLVELINSVDGETRIVMGIQDGIMKSLPSNVPRLIFSLVPSIKNLLRTSITILFVKSNPTNLMLLRFPLYS